MESTKLVSVKEYTLAKDKKGAFTKTGMVLRENRTEQVLARAYVASINASSLSTGKYFEVNEDETTSWYNGAGLKFGKEEKAEAERVKAAKPKIIKVEPKAEEVKPVKKKSPKKEKNKNDK